MAELGEAYNTLTQNQQKEIEELKKENEELHTKSSELQLSWVSSTLKLKEENAELKGKLESSNQGNLDARKCATERYEEIEIRRLFGIEQTDRIEELEKEIEELKQAIHDKNALIV